MFTDTRGTYSKTLVSYILRTGTYIRYGVVKLTLQLWMPAVCPATRVEHIYGIHTYGLPDEEVETLGMAGISFDPKYPLI